MENGALMPKCKCFNVELWYARKSQARPERFPHMNRSIGSFVVKSAENMPRTCSVLLAASVLLLLSTSYLLAAVWSPTSFYGQQFGVSDDLPTPGDYDGDGKADVAVFRPSSGTWFEQRSTSGFTAVQFGMNGDKPAPNAFVY